MHCTVHYDVTAAIALQSLRTHNRQRPLKLNGRGFRVRRLGIARNCASQGSSREIPKGGGHTCSEQYSILKG